MGEAVENKTVNYQTKEEMESGIDELTELGWEVDQIKSLTGSSEAASPGSLNGSYQVSFSREINSEDPALDQGKRPQESPFYWMPRWIQYGVGTLFAPLLIMLFTESGVGTIYYALYYPALLAESIFLGVENAGSQQKFFYILGGIIFWFTVGALSGSILSLPLFESDSEKFKFKMHVVFIILICIFGLMVMSSLRLI